MSSTDFSSAWPDGHKYDRHPWVMSQALHSYFVQSTIQTLFVLRNFLSGPPDARLG